MAPRWFLNAAILGALTVFGASACKRAPTPAPPPTSPPQAPYPLEKPHYAGPALPSPETARLPGEVLNGEAHQASSQGDFQTAAALQSLAVEKTGTDRYDLACDYSRIGQIDAAIYWLQEGAATEGFDATWASKDQDLVGVRADPRWPALVAYLRKFNLYWASRDIHDEWAVAPRAHPAGKPLDVLIWLHGFGSNAREEDPAEAQERADELDMGLVWVSGTIPLGPRSFRWAEDIARDQERVQTALRNVAAQLGQPVGRVMLGGFSQGAQMAVMIAASSPQVYAGAIALSPGTMGPLDLSRIQASTLLQKRGFVLAAGDGEAARTLETLRVDQTWLGRASAPVAVRLAQGQKAHRFPADFTERLPEWVSFVLGAGQ